MLVQGATHPPVTEGRHLDRTLCSVHALALTAATGVASELGDALGKIADDRHQRVDGYRVGDGMAPRPARRRPRYT